MQVEIGGRYRIVDNVNHGQDGLSGHNHELGEVVEIIAFVEFDRWNPTIHINYPYQTNKGWWVKEEDLAPLLDPTQEELEQKERLCLG